MNSSNGVGDGLMTLTNTGVSLKLTNSVGSGNQFWNQQEIQ